MVSTFLMNLFESNLLQHLVSSFLGFCWLWFVRMAGDVIKFRAARSAWPTSAQIGTFFNCLKSIVQYNMMAFDNLPNGHEALTRKITHNSIGCFSTKDGKVDFLYPWSSTEVFAEAWIQSRKPSNCSCKPLFMYSSSSKIYLIVSNSAMKIQINQLTTGTLHVIKLASVVTRTAHNVPKLTWLCFELLNSAPQLSSTTFGGVRLTDCLINSRDNAVSEEYNQRSYDVHW